MAFKELILDLPLQAFYTSSVEDISIGVKDYVALPNYTTAIEVDDVYVGGDVVKVGTDINDFATGRMGGTDPAYYMRIAEHRGTKRARYSGNLLTVPSAPFPDN